jgi:hypothetical protein
MKLEWISTVNIVQVKYLLKVIKDTNCNVFKNVKMKVLQQVKIIALKTLVSASSKNTHSDKIDISDANKCHNEHSQR